MQNTSKSTSALGKRTRIKSAILESGPSVRAQPRGVGATTIQVRSRNYNSFLFFYSYSHILPSSRCAPRAGTQSTDRERPTVTLNRFRCGSITITVKPWPRVNLFTRSSISPSSRLNPEQRIESVLKVTTNCFQPGWASSPTMIPWFESHAGA